MRARDVSSSSNRASAVRRARAAPLSSSRASRPRARRDGDESTERDDDGRGAAARRLMDALIDGEEDIEGVRRVIRMNPAPRPLLDAIEDGMFSHTHYGDEAYRTSRTRLITRAIWPSLAAVVACDVVKVIDFSRICS